MRIGKLRSYVVEEGLDGAVAVPWLADEATFPRPGAEEQGIGAGQAAGGFGP